MPGCNLGKASGLPALPALEPRRPSSSSRSSSRSTPSSSPGSGLHRPPVYREGMVFYPTTGGPSAGQAGLPHYEVGVAITARSESMQELEGEDAEGAVSSPGLGNEASAGVVPISGEEKMAVFVYEVGQGVGEVAFTRVVVEGYNL